MELLTLTFTVGAPVLMISAVCLFQVHDIEFAQIEAKVVEGLKSGNAALKKMHEVCYILVTY